MQHEHSGTAHRQTSCDPDRSPSDHVVRQISSFVYLPPPSCSVAGPRQARRQPIRASTRVSVRARNASNTPSSETRADRHSARDSQSPPPSVRHAATTAKERPHRRQPAGRSRISGRTNGRTPCTAADREVERQCECARTIAARPCRRKKARAPRGLPQTWPGPPVRSECGRW